MMGAYYEGQDQAVEYLRKMPSEAREYIAHHFRNALFAAIGSLAIAQTRTHDESVASWLKKADECMDHMVEDLEKIGC